MIETAQLTVAMPNGQREVIAAAMPDGEADRFLMALFIGTKNPRQLRCLRSLLLGPVTREALDRIAGASNSPQTVAAIRARGLPKETCLQCADATGRDRDGRPVTYGIYSLTDEGRRRVLDWLDRVGTTIAALLAEHGD